MATIASLIVNIAANTSDLQRSVSTMSTQLSGMETLADRTGKMLQNAFTVTAITAAAHRVGEYGGQINDLAVKLGTTVEQVQRLNHAATINGSSLSGVSTAIAQMSKHLVGGDQSAVRALQALNLDLDILRRLSPDQAFLAIGRAIATVPDPMQQSAQAMALLGRSGSDLLPMFKTLKQDMDDAVVASSSIIDAADELGDTLDTLTTTGTGLLAFFLLPLSHSLGVIETAIGKTITAVNALKNGFGGPELDSAVENAARLAQAQLDVAAANRQAAHTGTGLVLNWDEAARVALDLELKVNKQVTATTNANAALERLNATLLETVARTEWVSRTMAAAPIVETTSNLEGMIIPFVEINEHTQAYTVAMMANAEAAAIWSDRSIGAVTAVAASWQDQLSTLAQSFAQLGQIAGDSMSGLMRGIGSMIGGLDLGLNGVDSLKKGFQGFSAGNIQSGLASVTSGIGGIVAAAQVAYQVVSALINRFRGGEEGTQVNPARDEFLSQFSTMIDGQMASGHLALAHLLTLGGAGAGGGSLIQLLNNADTMAKFSDAIRQIESFLRERDLWPGFATGTPNLDFMNFGSGQLARLHGDEAVVPRGRAAEFAAKHGGLDELKAEMAGIRRDFRDLPNTIALALVSASNMSRPRQA